MKYMFCKAPFSSIEISALGEIYLCCPATLNISIGNIYKSPFEEIWYSDKAKQIRREILKNNYQYCNLKICDPINNIMQKKFSKFDNFIVNFAENPPYPLYVKYCHDLHCNIKCITCRDEFIINNTQQTIELDTKIEKLLTCLKNCKIVSMNGTGEALASKHGHHLIKAINKNFPHIYFEFHTNGVLCNKKLLEKLGILDKVISVNISMHASTKKTYEKIMLGSNYSKVLENLKFLAELKKAGQLKALDLYFVVHKINYKEMKDFVNFAQKYSADVYFWEYRKWANKWGEENYNKVAIYEKSHYLYNDFAKILQDPIFQQKNCHLNKFLLSIKPISRFEHIKNIIKDFKNSFFKIQTKYEKNQKYKIITILGIKIKFKRHSKSI